MNQNEIVICHLINWEHPFTGNFLASLFDLEKKLKNKNNNNKVIYAFHKNSMHCKWTEKMRQDGREIYFVKKKGIGSELINVLKKNNVSILHLHFTVPVIKIVLAKLFCPKIKIIVHYHNMFSPEIRYASFVENLKRKIKVFLYNRIAIDKICGCGKAVFEDLIKWGIYDHKCCYIDNCIVFSRLDVDIENGRDIYNIQNKKVLMIIGTAYYQKGVDFAVTAVKDIAEKYNIVFFIVCHNKDFIVGEIKKLLNHIPEWVILAPSREDISFYYKMSDLCLMPSREEGLPYALLESIYCETPVIRSDISEMAINLPNDIIVPKGDIPALQQSIEYVLNQTDVWKKTIIKEQKEYVLSQWNIDIWNNKIIDLYINVLNKRPHMEGKLC
ncbi:MAG: glycosyltransferase family 4 protein [Treponema sp.]|jgi:glycosyltransferase involved in cell wall biosynthesis|nr:glycosyltransferase family 4 protein [Treponema sp.]